LSIDFDKNVDYYKVLEIGRNSDSEEIRAAYINILRNLKAHPDLGGSHEYAVKVNIAYHVLSDLNIRHDYDNARNELYNHAHTSTKRIICKKCGTQNIITGEISIRNVCGKCGEQFIESNGGTVHALSPSPDVQLDVKTNVILDNQSEVIINFVYKDKVKHCLRCGKSWESGTDIEIIERCPSCRSKKWSLFRLFKCRFCQKRFVTVDLYHWAYKIYPVCPYCKKKSWNAGSEKNPLKWLLSKLSGL